MNWLYDLMDKFGLKTPVPALVAEEDTAPTWGDCVRCGKGHSRAPCTCLWRCRYRYCEGLHADTLNGKDSHDVPRT